MKKEKQSPFRQPLLDHLAGYGVLRAPAERRETAPLRGPDAELYGELLRLCHEGFLAGGLSVALDLRADELVGPLTHLMGGKATRLKIHDVRGERPLQLEVHFEGTTEKWELEELPSLVHNLNDLYRQEPGVKAVVVLGEWDDMLQLWCVEKKALPRLMRQPFFMPRNGRQLEELFSR